MARMRDLLVMWGMALMPLLGSASSDLIQDRTQMQQAIVQHVANRNFAEIERQAQVELETRGRFADGTWRLGYYHGFFRGALEQQIRDEKAWDDVFKKLSAVSKSRPAAQLLLADAHLVKAWRVRGSGFAGDVKSTDWPIFRRHVVEARDALDLRKRELANNPEWFNLRLEVANNLGESEDVAWKIFDEAMVSHRGYYRIYFEMFRYQSPIWHGSREKLLDLFDRVAQMGPANPAEGIYARLLHYAGETGYWMTRSPRVDAQVFRESVDQLLAAYPHEVNLQVMLELSCERGDKAEAAKIVALVREPVMPEIMDFVWKQNAGLYQSCKDWAQGRLDAFVMVHHFADDSRTETFLIR